MIDVTELTELIKQAFDAYSDVKVSPKEARQKQAEMIAIAVAQFVIGRHTVVTGTSATGGPVTGTGVIQ